MKDFYLNKDFFTHYLGCFYPLGKDFFIHIKSCKTLPSGFKKIYVFDVSFCVHFENEFVEVFTASVELSSRKIQLSHLKYILDSDLRQALHDSFPIAPAWLIPCNRVSVWLRRCYCSLCVYQNSDWI